MATRASGLWKDDLLLDAFNEPNRRARLISRFRRKRSLNLLAAVLWLGLVAWLALTVEGPARHYALLFPLLSIWHLVLACRQDVLVKILETKP